MAMWIPAPHAIEGYAPGISNAGPLSGVNQYGGYSTAIEAVFGCGYAADASRGRSLNCNYSLQQILTMGSDTS